MKNLYETQLKNLPLYRVNERLEHYKTLLHRELRAKGLPFDFHLWVSDEWFCPDGVPGFALPFYLFNDDLLKIQKRELGFVEGRSPYEILKLMRHELGHAIDNAYGLRQNKERQKVFGHSGQDYPEHYQPKASSRNFVRYLGDNYAQAHPDEDFAETFAYWLDPGKRWRFRRLSSVARGKLEFMDRLMRDLRHRHPKLKNKFRIDPIEKNTSSLNAFYVRQKKLRDYGSLSRLEHSMRSTFSRSYRPSGCVPLAQYLRKNKRQQCRELSQKEGVYQYEAEIALNKIIERAERLEIAAPLSELESKSPSLIQRNFRYLKQKDQLKHYL